MVEIEHGEPIRSQGSGRAHLPNGRCDSSHVERPKWRVQGVVAVDSPPEGPVLGDWTGSELPVEGSRSRLQTGVGLSLEGDWDVWWGGSIFCRSVRGGVTNNAAGLVARSKDSKRSLYWSCASWQSAAECPSPSAGLQGLEDCPCGAILSYNTCLTISGRGLQ